MGVVMTASPEPIPKAAKARCRAAVPELTAKACGDPTKAANPSSNRLTFGPVVIHPSRRVFTTSLISSSPMRGGEKGKKWLRILFRVITELFSSFSTYEVEEFGHFFHLRSGRIWGCSRVR